MLRTGLQMIARGAAMGIALLLLVALGVTSVAVAAAAVQPRAVDGLKSEGIGVISHRGAAADAPENTLAAVRAGIDHGADFIEIDLRLSRDEIPVLMHDAKVDRTTNGQGRVQHLSAQELGGLDAGSWFSDDFADERVPTVDEFFEVFTESKALAFIELKGAWSGAAVMQLAEDIEGAGLSSRVVLQSFSQLTMRFVTRVAPDVPSVLLTTSLSADDTDFVIEQGIDGVGVELALIERHPGPTSELRAADVGIFVYTLNDEPEWQAAADAGVQLIVTDHAAQLIEWLDQ